MKIAILTDDSPLSLKIAERAVKTGYTVSILTRKPKLFATLPEELTDVIIGSSGNTHDVERVVEGAQATIAAYTEKDAIVATKIMQNIVTGMHGRRMRRLVVALPSRMSDSFGAKQTQNGLRRFVASFFYHPPVSAVEVVKQSGLDWTLLQDMSIKDDDASEVLLSHLLDAEYVCQTVTLDMRVIGQVAL